MNCVAYLIALVFSGDDCGCFVVSPLSDDEEEEDDDSKSESESEQSDKMLSYFASFLTMSSGVCST